jgi:hypothetical protein
MNIVLKSNDRTLLSISSEELLGLTNALNEVCNGIHISKTEFETRLGVSRQLLTDLLKQLNSEPHAARRAPELLDFWVDQGSVMIQAISVFGDPVEMGETQSSELAELLKKAITDAS